MGVIRISSLHALLAKLYTASLHEKIRPSPELGFQRRPTYLSCVSASGSADAITFNQTKSIVLLMIKLMPMFEALMHQSFNMGHIAQNYHITHADVSQQIGD
jgi:hypothetical protein